MSQVRPVRRPIGDGVVVGINESRRPSRVIGVAVTNLPDVAPT